MQKRLSPALAALLAAAAVTVASSAADGTAIRVAAGDDLQAALDRARPGDTVLLEAGATFVGHFVLPRTEGDGWITVRSSTADGELPPPGVRIHPTDAPKLARLRSPSNEPALRTAPGAHHWRLRFLELGPAPGGDILALGDGSSRQHALDQVPHHLDLDRCYIHGAPGEPQRRGIALNSAATRIADSYIADIKLAGRDSQAIGGWNGPGPFEIVNSYLEAAGENFMLGGADPAIPGLVPASVIFRGNHVAKPTAWRDAGWEVKNLWELKNARDVLAEHNVFEHNWEAAQPGPAILLTPRNQDGRAPWSGVSDVVFRGNVVRRVASAFNVLGLDNNAESRQTRGIAIEGNLVYDVDADRWGGNGAFLTIGDGAADIRVERNTVVHTGSVIVAYGRPTTGLVFRGNLLRHNRYGIKGDGRASGRETIDTFFPGAVVTHNVLAGGPSGSYPDGNLFPSLDDWSAQFEDLTAGRLVLLPSSPFLRLGPNGSALGADVAAVSRAAARALTGGRR